MGRLVWSNGSFAWPPVIALAHLAASLVVVDYIWRIVVMPFECVILLAVGIFVVPSAAFVTIGVRNRQKRRAPAPGSIDRRLS